MVVAGWVAIDLASPRLLEIITISSLFRNLKAAALPLTNSNVITVPYPEIISLANYAVCWKAIQDK